MHKKIFQALIIGIVLILNIATVQAARLPVVGEDSNAWGTLLNEYLFVSLTQNGTIKDGIINDKNLDFSNITLADFTNDANYLVTVGNTNINTGTIKAEKLNLTDITLSDFNNDLGLGSLATLSTITTLEITDGTIVNNDISASAGIADTKLATISTAGKVSDTALSSTIANLDAVETITANWVNTANPWADDEVSDAITASNYLLLSGGTLAGNLDLGGNRLIIDNPGPTFSGTGSRQTVQADATFNAYTGSSYGAGVMGNVLSSGTGVSGGQSIIAGVIGKYNVVTNVGTGPKGAVVGEVGEDGAAADGAVIAVLGGDPSGTMTPGAAFTIRKLNSQAASKFNYGLDLFSAGNAPYNQPVNFGVADIRLSTGVTVRTGVGDPTGTCSTGDMYLDATGGTDTTVLFVCQNSAWAAK